jgi:Cu/Ag efflux pump CusA
MPVFTLEAQEGRLFKPLAFTKNLAIAMSAVLAITLIPAIVPLLVRGRIVAEQRHAELGKMCAYLTHSREASTLCEFYFPQALQRPGDRGRR